ncbi:hypothetical protein [Porphyromonas sp.]
MRSIYATLATLLLIVTTATAGFAQSKSKPKPKEIVTRTIIGCTLGESTIEQIKEKIKEQEESSQNESKRKSRLHTIIAHNVMFWGNRRSEIMFLTVDSILYEVAIYIDNETEADLLKHSLPEKYKSWRDCTISKYVGVVEDTKTKLTFAHITTEDDEFKRAVLIYEDKNLSKKADKISNTDL